MKKHIFTFVIGITLFLLSVVTVSPAMSAIAPALPARNGTRPITEEWLLNLRNTQGQDPVIRWLNNTQLIYAAPSINNKQESMIGLIDVHTGAHKYLTQGSCPRPSKDAQWIAFIRGKRKHRQLWIMRSNGKSARQLSHVSGGLSDYGFAFAWSPDSKYIALSHQPHYPYWEEKKPPQCTIGIIDRVTGTFHKISSSEERIDYLSWFPDGRELLFSKVRNGYAHGETEDKSWVQAINPTTGKTRILAAFNGLQQSLSPQISPDGKHIALMYDANNTQFDFTRSLGLITYDPKKSNSSPLIRLTHELNLSTLRWSSDNQRLYVRRTYGSYHQIYAIDAKTGAALQITKEPLNIESFDLSPNGLHLAWVGEDAQGTRIVRTSSSNGGNLKDLLVIPSVPRDITLSEVREFDWKTPDYPIRMRGLLFMPTNFQSNTRYPLIVDIHGGGPGASICFTGGILVNSPLEWHMWAAKGYAVFVPEFRSSGSFGTLAITRDLFKEHDLVNCDIKDIDAGIDELIAQGIIDENRIAVIGFSAGGRRANWVSATRHRYKAVVSKEGWADELLETLNAQNPSKSLYEGFGGPPWKVPLNYQKNSALFNCWGATIPTLFLMGNPKLGGADPYNTVLMLHRALKEQAVKTEYVQYLDEGHVFTKPKNLKDAMRRTIKWIEEHLGK